MKPPPTDEALLISLLELFPAPRPLARFEKIPAEQVPEPYDSLLVHRHHMTVTMERHYGGPVSLRVLQESRQGSHYARMILLEREADQQVVQFGIMRIDLGCCDPPVQDEILRHERPLGRILVEHNVLLQIVPIEYFKVITGDELMRLFGLAKPHTTYGRIATIVSGRELAAVLLEVPAPENQARPAKRDLKLQ